MKITIEHSTTPDGHDTQEVIVEKHHSTPFLSDVECALSLVPDGEYVQRIDIETDYPTDRHSGDGA